MVRWQGTLAAPVKRQLLAQHLRQHLLLLLVFQGHHHRHLGRL
jgi:hypothetical protein